MIAGVSYLGVKHVCHIDSVAMMQIIFEPSAIMKNLHLAVVSEDGLSNL